MTVRKYTVCIVIVVYFVLLTRSRALHLHVYERTFRFIDANATDAVFVTKHIGDVEECVRACEMTTSCRFVNYRVRGHLCSLTHYIGELNVAVRKDNTPGYVSWMKSNMLTNNDTDDCPECNATQSCVINASIGTCEIIACGRPPSIGPLVVIGNMYNVGNRLAYKCFDRLTGDYSPQTIVCTRGGHWESGQNVCGDMFFSLTNGTKLILTVFDEKVNKATAMANCEKEGAVLTTMLSLEKKEIFKKLLNGRSGLYWVDTQRVRNAVWRTSDGREQPMDEALWAEYIVHGPHDNCARMTPQTGWKLDDKECSDLFEYICEFS